MGLVLPRNDSITVCSLPGSVPNPGRCPQLANNINTKHSTPSASTGDWSQKPLLGTNICRCLSPLSKIALHETMSKNPESGILGAVYLGTRLDTQFIRGIPRMFTKVPIMKNYRFFLSFFTPKYTFPITFHTHFPYTLFESTAMTD